MLLDSSDSLIGLELMKWRPLTWKSGLFYCVYANLECICVWYCHRMHFSAHKTLTLAIVHLLDRIRHLRQVGRAVTDEMAVSDVEIRPFLQWCLISTSEDVISSVTSLPTCQRCLTVPNRCNLTSVRVLCVDKRILWHYQTQIHSKSQ